MAVELDILEGYLLCLDEICLFLLLYVIDRLITPRFLW